MTDLGFNAYVALSVIYVLFIVATLISCLRGYAIPVWTRWLFASAACNAVGVVASGAFHAAVVVAWLFCVIVAFDLLRKSWLTATLQHQPMRTPPADALRARIEAAERIVEAMYVFRYCPVAIAEPPHSDDCRQADANLVTSWLTMRIDEYEGCEVAE